MESSTTYTLKLKRHTHQRGDRDRMTPIDYFYQKELGPEGLCITCVDGGVVVGVVVTLEAVGGGGEACGVAAVPGRCVVSWWLQVCGERLVHVKRKSLCSNNLASI
jgi:hypothetical protein